MTLSDDVITQLDTMTSHPSLYLKIQNNGKAGTECFLVSHGETHEEPIDARNSTHECTTPFAVEIHAATDAALATYVTNVKASLRAKAVTSGFWEVEDAADPNAAEGTNVEAIGTVRGYQLVIA